MNIFRIYSRNNEHRAIPGSFSDSNQRELWSEDGSRKRASSDSRKCTRGFIDKSMEAGVAARLFCIKCNGVCMHRGAIAFIVATHASGPDDGFCSARRCASPALSPRAPRPPSCRPLNRDFAGD